MSKGKSTRRVNEPFGQARTAQSQISRQKILDGIKDLEEMTAERALQLAAEGVVFTQDGFVAWRNVGQRTLYESNVDLKRQVRTLCRGIRHRFKAALNGQSPNSAKTKSLRAPSESATATIRKLRNKIKNLEFLLAKQESDFIQLQHRLNHLADLSQG